MFEPPQIGWGSAGGLEELATKAGGTASGTSTNSIPKFNNLEQVPEGVAQWGDPLGNLAILRDVETFAPLPFRMP